MVLPYVLPVLKQKEKTEIKVGALRLLALMRDEERPLSASFKALSGHLSASGTPTGGEQGVCGPEMPRTGLCRISRRC